MRGWPELTPELLTEREGKRENSLVLEREREAEMRGKNKIKMKGDEDRFNLNFLPNGSVNQVSLCFLYSVRKKLSLTATVSFFSSLFLLASCYL